MWVSTRHITSLETRIKQLESELAETKKQYHLERSRYERRIEELIARLLKKAGVPEVEVEVKENTPEALLDMDIFEDISDTAEELIDNRKGDVVDAFAR